MNETFHSYFLFGGSFFTKLMPLLQAKGMITGQLSGISPLSEISLSTQSETSTMTCWLSELDVDLTAKSTDYFVLDLQLALTVLISTDAGLVSASPENMAHLTRSEVAIVDPILLPQQTISAALDRLAMVITKHFTANRIILIHTHNSPFWVAGNSLRAEGSKAPDTKHTIWLKELEELFCKKTGCYYVDVTRFYFYQKETGMPLTNVIYEPECYLDVADRILNIASGGDGKADRPNFAYSVDRYTDLYFTLHTKAFRTFLNPDYFLDRLILSAGSNFVRKYREELIDLDALDWRVPSKSLSLLKKYHPNSVLTKVCAAYYAVCNGNYSEPAVDYALMFRCDVVPETLLAHLKKNYACRAGLMPVQINRYNAGYHFARMMELDPTLFTSDKTVEKPVVIDIFGSCISRTLFNVQDNDFAINNYWFHVPPFEFRNEPVSFSASLFPAKPNWKDRLVKQQFEHSIFQKIQDSEGEWLVIDLYALISPNNFYHQNCLFGDFDHTISTKVKAKKVSLMNEPNPIGSQDAVIAALDPWLEIINKKYGSRIILVDGQRLQHWIGDDDRIYMLPQKHICNDFLARAVEYVRQKIDCYLINIGKYFLPDDTGFMRNTPVHKEDACYIASHNIVRYIIDNHPKEKEFSQYSGHIHMTHLERLAKHNSLAVLNRALPLNELDKAVLQLGYQKMQHQHKELAELYDRCDWSKSLDEILTVCTDTQLVEALRYAATLDIGKGGKIPSRYNDYPDNFVTDEFMVCKLPGVPDISIKAVQNDKDTVNIYYNAPPKTKVRIYRKTTTYPPLWVLVGNCSEGKFRDNTVAPSTDYSYCICAEIAQDSKSYLVSFTAPVTIRTALEAPALISAVHFDGINILRWAPVVGADRYRIYHKDSLEHKWKVCAIVNATEENCYTEPSQSPDGGQWYTVRALDCDGIAGGFHSGLCARPL